MATALIWFQLDLRLADNPALSEAVHAGHTLVPVYIYPPDEGDWAPGAASKWWLHQSLKALQADLKKHDAELVIRKGAVNETLQTLLKETGATYLYFNRRYEPVMIAVQKNVVETLEKRNITVRHFNAALLAEPWAIQNQAGKPFQVYSPYWRHMSSIIGSPKLLPAPQKWDSPPKWPQSVALDSLELEPKIKWAEGFKAMGPPGEVGAQNALKHFIETGLDDYTDLRNHPAETDGTSRMSPHLHYGEISPRQIWVAVQQHCQSKPSKDSAPEKYLKEVVWREFAYHLLYHFPQLPHAPLQEKFENFPWEKNPVHLKAWQRGQTGYPIIDAGMRQLWTTGWMHNRLRLAVGSFLVKHLLIPWQTGAAWFWDTLVDADLASNSMGWQWISGCGADAAPYFRVFNPILQGKKFDAQGEFVRQWVPELAKLPNQYIHEPWEAPEDVLQAAGVILGITYPRPIVDHFEARNKALDAFKALKNKV